MRNRLNKVVKPAKKAAKQKPIPVKIVSDAPSPSYTKEDNSWRARSDLETLQRAEEIRRDRARVKAAKDEAKKQVKMLTNVCK